PNEKGHRLHRQDSSEEQDRGLSAPVQSLARVSGAFYAPSGSPGPKRMSPVVRSQELPLRSVMPLESVTLTGYCAPATLPAEMIEGLPLIVTVNQLFVWPLRLVVVQVALVPQMMSATVAVFPPPQVGCAVPAFVCVPQSLCVT